MTLALSVELLGVSLDVSEPALPPFGGQRAPPTFQCQGTKAHCCCSPHRPEAHPEASSSSSRAAEPKRSHGWTM
eukprot:1147533-Pelagomonas_calceolata.AAC.6